MNYDADKIINHLNSEWARDLSNAKKKIVILTEENRLLREENKALKETDDG